MRQQTLAVAAEGSFEKYRKATRREVFLAEMNRIVPWTRLVALVEPQYPKAGNGRRPVGVERMLRMYFLQQWFNLSDPTRFPRAIQTETLSRANRYTANDLMPSGLIGPVRLEEIQ